MLFGARVIIAAFVAGQYVPGAGLTFAKLVAVTALPLGLFLMGHLRISRGLIGFAGLFALASTAGIVASRVNVNDGVLRALFEIGVGLAGALSLYTALTAATGMLNFFARLWVAGGVLTALLCVVQSIGAAPLLVVSEDALAERETGVAGFVRGTGLHSDPNFAATVLAIAFAFALLYVNRFRLVVLLVIAIGIVGTFSRMGIIVILVMWLTSPVVMALAKGNAAFPGLRRMASILLATSALSTVAWISAPADIRQYAAERGDDGIAAVQTLTGWGPGYAETVRTSVNPSSGEVRAQLAQFGVDLAHEQWPLGVGLGRLPAAIRERTVIANVSLHNNYLEIIATGGLLGVMLLGLYVVRMGAAIAVRSEALWRFRAALIFLSIASAIVWYFLTVTSNALFWLPLVLALAYQHAAQMNTRADLASD
jgi:O-Antigen ligase